MMTIPAQSELRSLGLIRLTGRNNILLAVTCSAVLLGLFLPSSEKLLDLLIVLSGSLTVATITVCLSRYNPRELSGFALLATITTCTCITLTVIATKLTINDTPMGLIPITLSKFNPLTHYCSPAQMIFILIAAIVPLFILTFRKSKLCHRTSSELFEELISTERIRRNFINKIARPIDDKDSPLNPDTNFFFSCIAISRLMIITLLIISTLSLTILLAAAINIINTPGPSVYLPTTQLNHAATFIITIHLICALITISVHKLIKTTSRTSLEKIESLCERHFTRKIKITAREISSRTKQPGRTTTKSDRLAPQSNKPYYIWPNNLCDTEKGYETIVSIITKQPVKTILMASATTENLPVTVPVNVAIRLAQLNHKVLLVDYDLSRTAIFQVFEITTKTKTPIATCIKNLWIAPADTYELEQNKNNNSSSDYDYIIIYAPNFSEHDRTPPPNTTSAMIFAKGYDRMTQQLQQMIARLGYNLLIPTRKTSPASSTTTKEHRAATNRQPYYSNMQADSVEAPVSSQAVQTAT